MMLPQIMRALRRPSGLLLVGSLCFLPIAWSNLPESADAVRESFLPKDAAAVTGGWADESRCIDCHEQAIEFFDTGHAGTLTPAASAESVQALRQLENSRIGREEGVSLTEDAGRPIIVRRGESDSEAQIEADWCFGSGAHARTWVATRRDSLGNTDLLELRWTWYHHQDDFGITPGQPEQHGAGYSARLGLLFDGPRAWRCFSCHATQLPADGGAVDEAAVHPGVTCQRCHGPREAHVASDGAIHDPVWKLGDHEQQVDRCAQCHRGPEEQSAESIYPGNPDIARFQPIGLRQSECFLQSDMSCSSCHDVHRPMVLQNPRRAAQCIQCHDPDFPAHTLCGAGMTTGCIDCHMPKLDTGRGLEFTDHWIRVPHSQGVDE